LKTCRALGGSEPAKTRLVDLFTLTSFPGGPLVMRRPAFFMPFSDQIDPDGAPMAGCMLAVALSILGALAVVLMLVLRSIS
jgi:hypothetical protein